MDKEKTWPIWLIRFLFGFVFVKKYLFNFTMKSFNNFIDGLFYYFVNFLSTMAGWFGMTYNQINIFIFLVLGPLVFIFLIAIIIRQHTKLKVLLAQLEEK